MQRPKSAASFSRTNLSNNQCNTTMFKDRKNDTLGFFKDTKVGSCSHIVEVKGRTVAIPYTVTNSKGRPLSAFKYNNYAQKQLKTIYRKDYSIKPNMHVAMDKKPLIRYDPNSYRNRLPTADFFTPHRNISNVEVGSKALVNYKQWTSTTKDSFRWPKPTPVTNTGILSDKFKLSHKKLTSIN